jgi:DNA-binding LacI/PurR family transcriptional regulator
MLGPSLSKSESAADRLRRDLLKSLSDEKLNPGDRILSERMLAKRLGVSYMTLRRALGGLVEEGLLERRPRKGIFIAGSAQNAGRARTATGRVRAIFYLPTISGMYTELHAQLARAMDEAGIDLVWSTIQEVVRPDSIERIRRWNDDAFIIVGMLPAAVMAALSTTGRPLLIVDIDRENMCADNVVLDNDGATYDAALRFFKAGRRRVAYVGGLIDKTHPLFEDGKRKQWPNSLLREMGVRRAYLAGGLPIDESLFRSVEYNRGARALGPEWFATPDRPDAVICFDCSNAAGFIYAARQRGLRVPEDIAIVGMATPNDQWVKGPPLIGHYLFDFDVLGKEAASVCLSRLANPEQAQKRVVVPWTFVPGETTGL